MLEVRIQLDPSQTQAMTSTILATYAFVSIIASPIIGHYADRVPGRKMPLLAGLCVELLATITVASTKIREQCGAEGRATLDITLIV